VLRSLTRSDWLSILGLDAEQVPQILLLRGTRNLRSRYNTYRDWFEDVVEVGSPNGLFEDVLIGSLEGRQIGYASVYGSAMASEITHVFGVLGTKRVILTGVCGALASGIGAGDLVVADQAGCGEGAVACYLPGRSTVASAPVLVDRAVELAAGHPTHRGAIWTTSALLAEGQTELETWRDSGHIAVDMESATVFGVAEWTGMQAASILSVFDNPLAGNHVAQNEESLSAVRQAGEAKADAIVRALIVDG
jgi:uridine phosphorylase